MFRRRSCVSICVTGGLLLAAAALARAQQPSALKAAPVAFTGESVHAGTLTYVGRDQTATFTTTACSLGDRPAWLFVDAIQGGRMPRVDSLFADRATLVPLRQIIHLVGTPWVVDMTFRQDSVVGEVLGDQGKSPIRYQVAPPVYAPGRGLWAAIATLPLAPGYSGGFRTTDVMEGDITPVVVRVTGTEHVQVPAGEFDAFRVEATPEGLPGGFVFWIERAAPHRVLREAALTPAGAPPQVLAELKTAY